MTAPEVPVTQADRGIPTDPAMIDYVLRWGGRCRDCADEDGTCPAKGLSCDRDRASSAILHVIAAINYGQANGYLEAPHLARIAALEAENARLREAVTQCGDQFAFYASEHRSAGKGEKAATNQRYADLCGAALAAPQRTEEA